MKLNFRWKNKAFVGALVSALLLGAGLAGVPGLSTAVTMAACAVIECEPVAVE